MKIKTATAAVFAALLSLIAAGQAGAAQIYPVDQARFMTNARFDFKIELDKSVARKDVTKGTWYLSVVRDDNDGLREVLVLNEPQENGTVRRLVDFRDVDNDVLHIDLYPFSELRRAE